MRYCNNHEEPHELPCLGCELDCGTEWVSIPYVVVKPLQEGE